MEALAFWEASPGRPRSGSISPLPAGPDGLSWGMPVAEAMAECGGAGCWPPLPRVRLGGRLSRGWVDKVSSELDTESAATQEINQ